jgi:hypothetical protein
MVINDFTIRRLADMVAKDDLDGIGNLLILMFEEQYHRSSTEDMMDTLRDINHRVRQEIAGRGESTCTAQK